MEVIYNWLIALYAAGLIVELLLSVKHFENYKTLKEQFDIDLFRARPDLIRYLVLKPLLWPYYFITEKSPIERLSHLFFKRYGDEGCVYYCSQGLKHFLNDVFRGKNRYQGYQLFNFNWPLLPDSEIYREYQLIPSSVYRQEPYTMLIIAIKKNKARLGILCADKSDCHAITPSRYQLDDCEKMSLTRLKQRLLDINREEAAKFIDSIDLQESKKN